MQGIKIYLFAHPDVKLQVFSFIVDSLNKNESFNESLTCFLDYFKK